MLIYPKHTPRSITTHMLRPPQLTVLVVLRPFGTVLIRRPSHHHVNHGETTSRTSLGSRFAFDMMLAPYICSWFFLLRRDLPLYSHHIMFCVIRERRSILLGLRSFMLYGNLATPCPSIQTSFSMILQYNPPQASSSSSLSFSLPPLWLHQ